MEVLSKVLLIEIQKSTAVRYRRATVNLEQNSKERVLQSL